MEAPEVSNADPKPVENLPPTEPEIPDNPEIKVPRAKIRITSNDRTPTASPNKKTTIRQSVSPTRQQSTYNLLQHTRRDSKLTDTEMSPTVKLTRYDQDLLQSPTQEKALNNGLDPLAMELISSSGMSLSMAGSEYSDKSDEIISSPKISREMKNLQKDSNNSKILSDYLSTSNESPRRSRKNKEVPIIDPDEVEEEAAHEEDEEEENIEITIKHSPLSLNDGAESDSTMIMPMEPPEKRRKSVSRSRSRARSRSTVRSRQKSIARLMKDELSVTSDKEDLMFDDEEDEEMSEVSFVTNRSIEGRAVNPPPKPGWDSFCFKCHTDTAVLSLACSQCKCSYHRHCVRPNPIPKNVDEFLCPECREIENSESSSKNKYGHDKIDPNTLAEMLAIILEKIRTYPDREHFENDIVVKVVKEPSQPLLVTQMSLKTLETRIKNRHYKVTEAFIHDIKQLEHNWNVVDRSKAKSLKSIVKYVNTEINELEACVFCYEKSFISADWFVQPCRRPHLLIWAKLKGYPYWPAKVMSIDARQQVDVRFFGAHDRAWVPSVHCMMFSDKDPNKTKGSTPTSTKNASKTQKGIADAMKEKDDYIENLREKFGFKYATFRQQLDANDLQGQLDFMLPGLKASLKDAKEGGEKEIDVSHKEKLTLKIIKDQSSKYQVEQKSAEPRTPSGQKDKPPLYKVLSKPDDSADADQSKKISFIIKRKSNVEQENDNSKRSRASDTASETSESNASVQSGKMSRKKAIRDAPKHRKSVKNVEPEPPTKKTKHADKQKVQIEDDDSSRMKALRRMRTKSVLPDFDKPLLVPVVLAPPATDDVDVPQEDSGSPSTTNRTNSRALSYRRSRSIEKDTTKDMKAPRRKSINVPSIVKRSISVASKKISPRDSVNEKPTLKESTDDSFDPTLVIKDEPVSDGEEHQEIMQSKSLTVDDIPNLMQDKSGKKKLIVISTTDGNSEASTAINQQFFSARAKKTFPNNPNQRQLETLTSQQLQNTSNGDWMVCIPQALIPSSTSSTSGGNMNSPPTSNRSTPSDSQISISQVRTSQSSSRNSQPAISISSVMSSPSTSSRSNNLNMVPSLYNFSSMASPGMMRRNSVQSGPVFVNGQRLNVNNSQNHNMMPQRHQSIADPPRLLPRPQGVFAVEGTNFNRDTGPVSRMFTDNAHRIGDFFRNIITDTVAAFAPEVPQAENLMLRAENEKLQREMQVTKSDCQQKMQSLRREHQDEIDSIRKSYEDKLANLESKHKLEKNQLIGEIRQQCEVEKLRAIDITRKETKKTTWCCNCTKEARFYCCWNTSYCGPQCQKSHWQHHQKYCTNKNSANETQQQALQQAQQVNKQTNTDIPLVTVQSPLGNLVGNRQALVLRPQQQLQQQQSSVLTPPCSIQQHIIINANAITSQVNSIVSSIPINHAINSQPIIVSQFNTKNQAIRAIYHEQAFRENSPKNLIVQTVPRHDSANINVISKESLQETHLIRVNSTSTPVITPTVTE